MRNLKVLSSYRHFSSLIQRNDQMKAVSISSYTSSRPSMKQSRGYVLVLSGWDLVKINTFDNSSEYFVSIEDFSHSDNASVVDMFYNSTSESAFIAQENGDVISISLTFDNLRCTDEPSIQVVGNIPSGIQCVALSPDTEIVVFLTKDNTLILMSGLLDNIFSETDLLGSDQGEQDMVNVGWGRKETQFHGSEGKAAAKQNLDLSSLKDSLSETNTDVNRKSYISWRGDSSLLAVNYRCPVKNIRKVKIFDKCGFLQCTSEFLPGLGSVLSWKPSGNLIALPQMLPNKNVICFMEKNGLRHGEFTLPANIKVLDLAWNAESTILSAVCVEEAVEQQCVLLWTTGNYHWYMKQRLHLQSAVATLCWDELVSNLVHILLMDGTYLAFQWVWNVDHCDHNLAVVAVIDGSDLKLSAFQKCVIPPPMSWATVTLPSPALQVMFKTQCTSSSPNDCCVYMSDGRLAFINGMDSKPQLHRLVDVQWQREVPVLPTPACLSQWLWLTAEELICATGVQLCLLQLHDTTAIIKSTIQLEEPVLTVTRDSVSPRALVQLRSGMLLTYEDGNVTPLLPLPEPCITVQTMSSHVFARAQNKHFYMDGELLADNVTSFFCCPQFLITTLSSHQLCVTNADSNFQVEAEGRRKIERGATVVVVTGHSVILQMPRGNLETVQPRGLTLVTAAHLLDTGDYKALAQLLRRQRIDSNLCVDYNPSAFLLSAPRFVAQVRDPDWLSVFIAELNEQDVTRSTYSAHYKYLKTNRVPLENKVKRVCTALREAMSQSPEDCKFFMKPILSLLVREGRVGDAVNMANTDQALSYLTLLMDTERLYQEALAVYNLDKALMIAGKSLKDPKEYVAYLNDLRAMEPAYMKFTIDKKLRKPHSALRNLAQCVDSHSTELLQYVQDTRLYTLALQLFKDKPEMQQEVCVMYGDHLVSKKCYREAGLMYHKGGEVTKAVSALTNGCWQQCLTLAAEHNFSESDIKQLQVTIYLTLTDQRQYKEAAQLCKELGWHERAVSSLVAAQEWVDAVYLSRCQRLDNFIESFIKPSLMEHHSRILGNLKEKKDEMDRYSTRLEVVRKMKANLGIEYEDLSYIKSDTSSLSSFATSSAGTRTTKNTRKAQRKMWSLKEGNPREERALLYIIRESVLAVEQITTEVHNLCLVMAELDLETNAAHLHGAMLEALTHIDHIRNRVWPFSSVKKSGSDAESFDPTSIDIQLDYPPPSCASQSWRLDIFS